MEKIIVKFSRPLLFRESIDGKYYLAYGFVLGKKENYDENTIYDYVGYLAGMHLFASGADYIDVNYDCGISIWMDKKGNPHTLSDKWMKKMADKCRNLLGLTYEVLRMDVDEQTYDECVNSDYFITDEKFFDRLENQGAEQGDDLPF